MVLPFILIDEGTGVLSLRPLLLLHLCLQKLQSILQSSDLLPDLVAIFFHLLPQGANSRLHNVLLPLNLLFYHALHAFFDSSHPRVDFDPVGVDLMVHLLLQYRVHLQGPLLGHELEVAPLNLDSLTQLVPLLVHVDDDALQYRLLLGELVVDFFV